MKQCKKLIEVALPLPEINDASAYDKMPGIGPHPKGIHQWWARLPLPSARAVLFASVVDDPECHPEIWPTDDAQKAERERLFDIVRRMMGKKLHESPEVYAEARAEMLRHCDGRLPAVFDPFAGGGSIPLEANRLGFETYAGDLNPVAVLLNKCNLELAPRWAGLPPINPRDRSMIGGTVNWQGTRGLAADLRYYGQIIHERAVAKIGHLYPKARLPEELGGGEANVIAWIWARTIASDNAAAQGKHVPLVSTYWLSSTERNSVWLEPIVNKIAGTYRFEVRSGSPKDRKSIAKGTKLGRGAKFGCLLTGEPISEKHIKSEARAGRTGMQMLAVVAEGQRGKTYLSAETQDQQAALGASPLDCPTETLVYDSRYLTPPGYGMTSIDKLFTRRQLAAIETLSDLIKAIRNEVVRDAASAALTESDAAAYADSLLTFLALAVDRCCDFNNALCRWSPSNQKVMNLFGRQAIPMVWDFAEANILADSVGGWSTCNEYVADCVEVITAGSTRIGHAGQIDVANDIETIQPSVLLSTDPPYYDNVPYADISDFFYVWLRRNVGSLYPELFSTLLVPKMPELTASPQRFNGDKERAKEHFESGFRKAFTALREKIDLRFPLTVYYAFRQDDEESGTADDDDKGRVDLTTGWETLLEALVSSGFQVTATWPVRASQAWRMRAMGSNALASYIVLACRPRPADATQTDRRTFVAEIKRELPVALRHLQQGNIAPVDFAQAAIGPGMAIYSRYSRVLESGGNAMTVRMALSLINQTLTEVLSEQEDEFDANTRWAIAWFEQQGFSEGDFGLAEVLSKAKVTSVNGLQQAALIHSKSGKVRLLRPEELSKEWDPTKDKHLNVWEMAHQLLRVYYYDKKGDEQTADLLRQLGSRGELARDLAYRLFALSEKRKTPQDALAYNALVLGWPEISRLAREHRTAVPGTQQTEMYGQE